MPIAILSVLLVNCSKVRIPVGDLTNQEQMNLLMIPDPLVWNTLAIQSAEIDTTDGGMKASNGMDKMKEYPRTGYYFTLFEDLYPSEGDYDFNDVILRTKFTLDGSKGVIWGDINAGVDNKGGTLETQIGLMVYSVVDDRRYARIENSQISINGIQLTGTDPYTMDLPEKGEEINLCYVIEDPTNNVTQIWFSWFIIVKTNDVKTEIHTSGFPVSTVTTFEIPQRDYLTVNNLPWGLEIEAEEFFIPKERALFLNAYPEFQEWAESGGVKNRDWFKNPDLEYIQ